MPDSRKAKGLNVLQQISQTAWRALTEYRARQPLVYASSTSFFTLFALPPILIILITILGSFIKPASLSTRFFIQLRSYFGESGAEQIRLIFENFRELADNWWVSILGFFFLVFVATTLIDLIQKFINSLWDIRKRKRKRALAHSLLDRVLFFLFLLIGGILFLLSLSLDALVAFLGNRIDEIFPFVDEVLVRLLNAVFALFVVTLWFTLLFKIIPNAQIRWRPALVGGLVTSLLFSLGKFILTRVLINSNIGTIFGAAGSIVLILLFIFYSSLIFYYGAVFTKNYAAAIGQPIRPGNFSVGVKLMELEEEKEG